MQLHKASQEKGNFRRKAQDASKQFRKRLRRPTCQHKRGRLRRSVGKKLESKESLPRIGRAKNTEKKRHTEYPPIRKKGGSRINPPLWGSTLRHPAQPSTRGKGTSKFQNVTREESGPSAIKRENVLLSEQKKKKKRRVSRQINQKKEGEG